jgi:hypothetical protein
MLRANYQILQENSLHSHVVFNSIKEKDPNKYTPEFLITS